MGLILNWFYVALIILNKSPLFSYFSFKCFKTQVFPSTDYDGIYLIDEKKMFLKKVYCKSINIKNVFKKYFKSLCGKSCCHHKRKTEQNLLPQNNNIFFKNSQSIFLFGTKQITPA